MAPKNNKYKLPLYFKSLSEAVEQSRQDLPVVQQRLNELKAYLHYMVLYYNWSFDQVNADAKDRQAAALCLYLAKINKLQIVNSYSLINNVLSKYKISDDIYKHYNVVSGTAYMQGALKLITEAEINKDFLDDLNQQKQLISDYKLEDIAAIKKAASGSNLAPLDTISLSINYTQAKDFASRSEFYFVAEKGGTVEINYNPVFEVKNEGQINFTVETTEKSLGVIKDFTAFNDGSGTGHLVAELPGAGDYKLTVSCMFKASVKLEIITNGNYFFKTDPFLGNTIENYRSNLVSLPGYFYVPHGLRKVYFSLMNSRTERAGFAKPSEIARAFLFKDAEAEPVYPQLGSSVDSALFYIDVPPGKDGLFWQASKMEAYKLCFANINNVLWYASKKNCPDAAIKIDVMNSGGKCITRIGTSAAGAAAWKIQDGVKEYLYNSKSVNLPPGISPSAYLTLTIDSNCRFSKKLSDYPGYLAKISACAAGAFLSPVKHEVVIYPNPGKGLFKCTINSEPVTASTIDIYSATGAKTASFINSQQFSLADLPAAMYMYRIMIDAVLYTGKLVKM